MHFIVPFGQGTNFQIREFGRHFFSHRSNSESKGQMPIAKLKYLVANGDRKFRVLH
jgi:hypothetical protein